MRLLFFLLFFCSSINGQNSKHTSIKSKQDSTMFKFNMDKALSFFREKKLDSFKKYTKHSYTLSKKPKDLQKVHFYLATYYKYSNIKDSAYYHYNQSKNILLNIGDSITAGRRMLNIAVIQLKENDFIGSEITSVNALKYVEKSNEHIIKYKLYRNLSDVGKLKNNFKDALKYSDLSYLELKKDTLQNIDYKLQIINNK